MSFNKTYDLAIVGGGPAGATAALYASRLGLKAILIDKSIWPRDKISFLYPAVLNSQRGNLWDQFFHGRRRRRWR